MKSFDTKFRNKQTILALGPESDGNLSFYKDGKVYFSDSLGDLLDGENFEKFKKTVLDIIQKNGKPDVVISDLHPLFRTTDLGGELRDKFSAEFVQIQHHLAHIFSCAGDYIIQNNEMPKEFLGIACDGTGYGLDEKIWGGEIFKISNFQFPISNECSNVHIQRIGKLEDQILIGGELAIKEPARMLISILGKFMLKDEVYRFVSKYYNQNQFELLWNQSEEGFNCLETSSTGRVLDAVSVLLGFSGNERPYKHAPIDLLEKNSSEPYEIEFPFPVIPAEATSYIAHSRFASDFKATFDVAGIQSGLEGKENKKSSRDVIPATNRSPESNIQMGKPDSGQARMTNKGGMVELQITLLFEYLVKNLDKDKKRLAATAQMYLAKGLWEICLSSLCHPERSEAKPRDPSLKIPNTQYPIPNQVSNLKINKLEHLLEIRNCELEIKSRDRLLMKPVFFAGGVANNKIISDYLRSKRVIVSQKIPRGDGGISFGQLMYYLANAGD